MIKLDSIYKSYGKKPILTNITADIPKQKITSLIGANGAGKSTLLMIMAKLLAPSRGEVRLDGKAINNITTANYAHRVATLRQANNINLRLKVEDLVAFGRFPYSRGALTNEDWQVINESIDFLGLVKLRHHYLDEISGGQRQMAFLAMTITQQTDLLLLDEPLNNLDIKHCVQIMQALRRLCDEQGRTVVLVIHDINFAVNYSDYVIALKNGQLMFDGVVDNVITEENLSQLYDLKFDITRFGKCDEGNCKGRDEQSGLLCNYFMTNSL